MKSPSDSSSHRETIPHGLMSIESTSATLKRKNCNSLQTNAYNHLAGHTTWRAIFRVPTRLVTLYLCIYIITSILVVIMLNQEQKMQNALNDLYDKRFRSIRQTALYNQVAPTTLAYRAGGRKSKTQSERRNQRFINQKERSII